MIESQSTILNSQSAIPAPAAPVVAGLSWRQILSWTTKGSLAIADQGLFAGSNFLLNVLLARWLAPADYGAFALAFSLFLLLAGFHNAALIEPMTVLGPASFRDNLRNYISQLSKLHFGLTLCFASLAGAVAIALLCLVSEGSVGSALAGMAIALPWILLYWLLRRASYVCSPGLPAVLGAVAYSVCLFACILLFRQLGALSCFSAFAAQAVASAVAGIVLVVCLRLRFTPWARNRQRAEILREHWRYGRWVAATTIFHWLSGGAYYVLVALFLPMREVAGLRALQNLSAPFSQATVALSMMLLPWASTTFSKQGTSELRRAISRITLLFGLVALGYVLSLTAFSGWVMQLVYAGRYNEFSFLLPLALLPVLSSALTQAAALGVRAMQAPSEEFLAYLLPGLLTISLGVALTRAYGLRGVLVGGLCSSLGTMMVLRFRWSARIRRASCHSRRKRWRFPFGVGPDRAGP